MIGDGIIGSQILGDGPPDYAPPVLECDATGVYVTKVGTPYGASVPPLPIANQTVTASGLLAVRFGQPSVQASVSTDATGSSVTDYGAPVSGRVTVASGFAATIYGAPALSMTQQASGSLLTQHGTPIHSRTVTASGSSRTRYGQPRATRGPIPAKTGDATGVSITNYGVPVGTSSLRAFSMPPSFNAGRPLLVRTQC